MRVEKLGELGKLGKLGKLEELGKLGKLEELGKLGKARGKKKLPPASPTLLYLQCQAACAGFFVQRRQIMPCFLHYVHHFVERNAMATITKISI